MKYLTIRQLGEKLGGRSRSAIYRDFENGDLPKPFHIGRMLYWREDVVDEFLARKMEKVQ